jgi:hypothetical protein
VSLHGAQDRECIVGSAGDHIFNQLDDSDSVSNLRPPDESLGG